MFKCDSLKDIANPVKLLLELGACVDEVSVFKGLEGVTALHTAAENGHDKIVTLLLHHRADVQKIIIDGSCALHCVLSFCWRQGPL